MCANANTDVRVLLPCLEDTDTKLLALEFGPSQFLGNAKHTVSEDNAPSGNTAESVVVKLEWMTITEMTSQVV